MEISDETAYSQVIILTGSSGSGKSTVAKILEGLGARIVSADTLSRLAVEKGSSTLLKLKDAFGPEVLLSDGELDRKFLRTEIFSDPNKKQIAEDIIHPVVRNLALIEFKEAISNSQIVIYDVPLYFETEHKKKTFKSIIVVYTNKENSIKRIIDRDQLSVDEAELRYAAQMPPEEKIKFADYIIDNSGTLEELNIAVKNLWESITISK